MKFDMEKLGKDISLMVKNYVFESFKQLNEKIDNIQLQKGDKGDKGDKGEDGKSIELSDVMPHIKKLVIAEINDLPMPEKGEKGDDGLNGKDAEPIDVDFVVDKLYHKLFSSEDFVQRVVKLIPVPKDGRDGLDAKQISEEVIAERVLSNLVIPKAENGKDGKDGKDAFVDYLAIGETIREQIKQIELPKPKEVDEEKIIAEIKKYIPLPQIPKDGKDGVDGKSVDKDEIIAEVIKAIPTPQNGKDGVSVSVDDLRPHLDASIAKWQLDFERNAYATLQRSVDSFPKPVKGDKGEDGFGIESFEQVDERTVKATYKRGDEVIVKEFKFPALIYKGVFKQGSHEQGDAVTYGGSLWIAKVDTEKAPMDGEDWQLAVKKGRDANKT